VQQICKSIRVAGTLLLLSASAPATATAAETTPEELRALEASLQADAASRPSTSPVAPTPAGPPLDLALILDIAASWSSDDADLQSGAHDPRGTGFTFQQLELSAGSNVDPFFRFDANLVFTTFGVEVEEAFATTSALPAGLQVRAGQFLTRFGRLNAAHPHAWSFLGQNLVMSRMFGSEGNRGLGAELSWLAPMPWFFELSVSGIEGNGECCTRSHASADTLPVETPADLVSTLALKQFFPLSPSLSVLVGASFQTGPNASGRDNRSELYGADLFLRWRPVGDPDRFSLNWESEAIHRRQQVPRALVTDTGASTQLVAQWTPEWSTGLRGEWLEALEDDPWAQGEARTRGSAQATWYPSHFSRVRAQVIVDDASVSGRDAPVLGVLLGLEVVTGSHGSHAY
jgi:hypothetical protein